MKCARFNLKTIFYPLESINLWLLNVSLEFPRGEMWNYPRWHTHSSSSTMPQPSPSGFTFPYWLPAPILTAYNFDLLASLSMFKSLSVHLSVTRLSLPLLDFLHSLCYFLYWPVFSCFPVTLLPASFVPRPKLIRSVYQPFAWVND